MSDNTSEEEPLNSGVTPQHLATRGLEEALEQFIKQERELNEKAIDEGITVERTLITSAWCEPYAKTIVGAMYDTYFAPDSKRPKPEISVEYDAGTGRVNINPTNKTAETLFEIVGSNPEILGNAETI